MATGKKKKMYVIKTKSIYVVDLDHSKNKKKLSCLSVGYSFKLHFPLSKGTIMQLKNMNYMGKC